MEQAMTSLHMREQKVADVADLIEKDLFLLGATGIEDKLQDQVPETIAAFLMADIHVWMLTGDKQETAINIAYSCKLIDPTMALLIINEDSLDVSFSLREESRYFDADLHNCLTDLKSPSSDVFYWLLLSYGTTLRPY
jgi:phospholipid-transporting ATPase